MDRNCFKIYYPPCGYCIGDINNGNTDIFLVFQNKKVYVATVFTLENIDMLMRQNQEHQFWASDMFIVKDLRQLTVRKAIWEIFRYEYFDKIFRYIGDMDDVFDGEYEAFDKIPDMTYGILSVG